MELPFIDLRHAPNHQNHSLIRNPNLQQQQQQYSSNNNIRFKNYASTTYIDNKDIIITNVVSQHNNVNNNEILLLNVIKVTEYNHKVIHRTNIDLSVFESNFDSFHVLSTVVFLKMDETEKDYEEKIQIGIWNELGQVLLLLLNYNTFQLLESKVVYVLPNIVGSSNKGTATTTTTEKVSAVVWLNSDMVVIGVGNRLICVDILKVHNGVFTYWSGGEEEKSLFSRLSGSILGVGNGESSSDSMALVLALSIAKSKDEDGDGDNKIIFSLHADGIVRIWSVYGKGKGYVYPSHKIEVNMIDDNLTSSSSVLPHCSTWTDWCLESRMINNGNEYALAMNIVSQQSQTKVTVIHGMVADMELGDDATSCTMLVLPDKAKGVIDMTFSDAPLLQVIFSTNDPFSSILVHYHSRNSTDSFLSAITTTTPTIVSHTLEDIPSSQLSYLHSVKPKGILTHVCYADRLQDLDSYFLKMIYKPIGVCSCPSMESSIEEACGTYFPSVLIQKHYPAMMDSSTSTAAYIVPLLREYFQVKTTLSFTMNSSEKPFSPFGNFSKRAKGNNTTSTSSQEDMQVEQYFQVWKEFALIVHKVEGKLRQPLLLTSGEYSSYLLRIGSFSCIGPSPPSSTESSSSMDQMALRYYNNNHRTSIQKDLIDQKVRSAIETASIHSPKTIEDEVWNVIDHSCNGLPYSSNNNTLPQLSNDEWLKWSSELSHTEFYPNETSQKEAMPWWNNKSIPNTPSLQEQDILLSTSYLIQQSLHSLEEISLSKCITFLLQSKAKPDTKASCYIQIKHNIFQHYLKIKVVQWCFSQLDHKQQNNKSLLDLFILSQGDLSTMSQPGYDTLGHSKKIHDVFFQYILSPTSDNHSLMHHMRDIQSHYPSIILRLLLLVQPNSIPEFIQKVDMTSECLFRESAIVDVKKKDLLQEMAAQLGNDLFGALTIRAKSDLSRDIYKLLPSLDSSRNDPRTMCVELSPSEQTALAHRVQLLLFPTQSDVEEKEPIILDSIRYLVELPSISILLHEWFHDESTVLNAISDQYPDVSPNPLWRDFIIRLWTASRSLQNLHLVTTLTNNCNLKLSTSCSAIYEFQSTLDKAMIQSMPEYTSLCTFCLKYALQTKHWEFAFQACCYHPSNPTKGIPLLVVTMVQHGAIRDFLLLSKHLLQDHAEYYDVVGHALYQAYSKEQDVSRGIMYLQALYSLHVYHEYWKKASQVMNIIYHLQLQEYNNSREKNIITPSDIYLSTMACYHSLCLEQDDTQRYLISSKSMGDVSPIHTDDSCDSRLYLSNDLQLRMIVTLAMVYYENDVRGNIGTSMRHGQDTQIILRDVKNVIVTLAEKGCFALATILAKTAAEKVKTNGVYDSLLQEIFCQSLVPFAVILSRPTPINASDPNKDYERGIRGKAPDLSTLYAQLWTSPTYTSFLHCDEWRPSTDSRISRVKGLICTELLQSYLTTAPPSVVLDVADKMLVIDDGMSSLPTWLLQLFQPQNGSFASFPTPNSITNSGNPTDLLRLYIRHGMYTTACQFVCTILSLPKKAGLPEKGDIEFVPYNDIDKLWKMSSYFLKEQMLEDNVKKEMTEGREEMKIALIHHFKHLKESEVGRMSSRILRR